MKQPFLEDYEMSDVDTPPEYYSGRQRTRQSNITWKQMFLTLTLVVAVIGVFIGGYYVGKHKGEDVASSSSASSTSSSSPTQYVIQNDGHRLLLSPIKGSVPPTTFLQCYPVIDNGTAQCAPTNPLLTLKNTVQFMLYEYANQLNVIFTVSGSQSGTTLSNTTLEGDVNVYINSSSVKVSSFLDTAASWANGQYLVTTYQASLSVHSNYPRGFVLTYPLGSSPVFELRAEGQGLGQNVVLNAVGAEIIAVPLTMNTTTTVLANTNPMAVATDQAYSSAMYSAGQSSHIYQGFLLSKYLNYTGPIYQYRRSVDLPIMAMDGGIVGSNAMLQRVGEASAPGIVSVHYDYRSAENNSNVDPSFFYHDINSNRTLMAQLLSPKHVFTGSNTASTPASTPLLRVNILHGGMMNSSCLFQSDQIHATDADRASLEWLQHVVSQYVNNTVADRRRAVADCNIGLQLANTGIASCYGTIANTFLSSFSDIPVSSQSCTRATSNVCGVIRRCNLYAPGSCPTIQTTTTATTTAAPTTTV